MTTGGAVLAALSSLFVLVLIGSIVPVVPTGAVVSATAAMAAHRDPATVVAAILVGAIAAYLGDAVTYALCRLGGEPLVRRLILSRRPATLAESMKARLRMRPTSALVVARLLPAGRIPMLLAAAVVGVAWRRFCTANVTACLVWSLAYAGIGLLGGAVFPEPWQGVLAAVALAVVFTLLVSRIRRRRVATVDVSL